MAEFGDFASDKFVVEDPFAAIGGLEEAVRAATEAGENAFRESIDLRDPGKLFPEDVIEKLPEITDTVLKEQISKIPVTEDGVMGKQIQSKVLEGLTKDPIEIKNIHDTALSDAIELKNGNIREVTSSDLKAAYEKEISVKAEKVKAQYKTDLSKALSEAVTDEKGAKVFNEPAVNEMVDRMVEDPKGAETELTEKGAEIEKETPDWKEQAKEKLGNAGKRILELGGKGLLVLAIIGALIPGAGGPLQKLAEKGGEIAGKVVTTAINILMSFLGGILKPIWTALKGPLMIVGIILLILLVGYIYKTFLKRSG